MKNIKRNKLYAFVFDDYDLNTQQTVALWKLLSNLVFTYTHQNNLHIKYISQCPHHMPKSSISIIIEMKQLAIHHWTRNRNWVY